MNILLTNENRGRGGAEQFTLTFARLLAGAGHQVEIACRPDSWLAEQGLPVRGLGFSSEIDLIAAWKASRGPRPQVVHCQASRDLALFGPLCRWVWPGVPLIKSEHSFLDQPGSGWLRWCYRQCQAVVAVSQALRQQMQSLLGLLPYEVIPNGMDMPDLDQQLPEPLRENRWIGYLGGLLPGKGVEDLLPVAAPLLREDPRLRLLIAGEGPARAALESQIQEMGLVDRVWLAGHVDKPLPYLRGLQVLLQPSRAETFSLVAMEAMALEVPVVARASAGGITEVVVHDQTGYLGEDLQGALRAYLLDEDLRSLHGRQGRQRVREQFSWEHILPRWEALYQRLIKQAP